jgi:Fe-S cluster assembly protein SufB
MASLCREGKKCAENFGQFERTLNIADEGSEVMYMKGCTAPGTKMTELIAAVSI